MKLSAAIVLVLVASLAAVALPAPPQTAPATAVLQFAAPATASSCTAAAPAFLPAPLARDVVNTCGDCSSVYCKGRPVGSFCGPTTVGRCVIGPSCTTGAVTCLCQ